MFSSPPCLGKFNATNTSLFDRLQIFVSDGRKRLERCNLVLLCNSRIWFDERRRTDETELKSVADQFEYRSRRMWDGSRERHVDGLRLPTVGITPKLDPYAKPLLFAMIDVRKQRIEHGVLLPKALQDRIWPFGVDGTKDLLWRRLRIELSKRGRAQHCK